MTDEEETRIPRPRMETLSDLIFGLALSIGAISLLTSNPPKSIQDVFADLLAFGFSFLVLISVWMRYTSIMSVLPVETGTTVLLNMIMLLLVSLEPYLFNLVTVFSHDATTAFLDEASVVYALDMTGLAAVLGFFTHQLTIEERKLVASRLVRRYRSERNFLFLASCFFLFSAIPEFWSIRVVDTPVRFLLWIIPIAMLQAVRILYRR